MTNRESQRLGEEGGDENGDESFLGRWSRLKTEARGREANPAPVPDSEISPLPDEAAVPTVPDAPPPAVELPDLELLDQDSDYSAFLTPGVDAALRQRALRKLFSSPKFNVFDGLDTYRDDFTSFPPLGDVVTADMRHHLERLARELVAGTEEAPSPATAAPPPAEATAATAGATRESPQSPDTPPPDNTETDDDHLPA
jgi:hypothetical protein